MVLAGVQVRYTFNSAADELERLREGGVTSARWTLWPYTVGLGELIREFLVQSGEGVDLIESIEEVHLSKLDFSVVQGTLLAFLFGMYLNQVSNTVESWAANERISDKEIRSLKCLVDCLGDSDARQIGYQVCTVLSEVNPEAWDGGKALNDARAAVVQLQNKVLGGRSLPVEAPVLTTGFDDVVKPLRGKTLRGWGK